MYLKNNTITFSLYFLISIVLIELMKDPYQAILIWPAAGIGTITALVWGIRVLPALYLAELLINMYLYPYTNESYTLTDFVKSNLYISAGLFRCYFGAYLIRYFIGYPNSLISYQTILKFFLIVGPIATLASTIYFDIINYSLGNISMLSFSSKFFDWWFGDLLGFIIFAPMTMIIIAQPKSIWKPRYLTVGVPVILIFLSMILIYNKLYVDEQKRLIDNLKVKSEILVTKINESNNWMGKFLNYTYSHFLPRINDNTSLTAYFNTLTSSESGSNAMVWFYNGENDFVKVSKEYSDIEFNKIKTFNFQKIINDFRTAKIPLSTTRYIQELNQFINVFEIKKLESALVIIIVHDFIKNLNVLITNYELNHVDFNIKLQDGSGTLNLIDSNEKLPLNNIKIETKIQFNNEEMLLVLVPTSRYFIQNQSTVSTLLSQIGLLFAGLIGIMLLIITGKTTYTDIRVNEQTLELDQQTKDLRARKKQYQLLIEQHPVILWRQDITKKRMSYISKKVVELYGYPLNQWIHEDDFWLNHIHTEDRPQVVKKIESSILNKNSFVLEYRFIKADKSIAWIKDVINITNDRHFNTQLVGLMIDVSETKEAISGQNISESKYRTLFKHAVDPLIIIDLDSNIIKDSNDKAISLFGLNNINGQVSLTDFSILTQPDGSNSKSQLTKIFKKLLNTQSINFDWTLYNKAHQEIICNLDIVKLPNQINNIVLVNINDITEKRQHERKINQLAYYDNLTKLPNRSYFYSKFEYFHGRAIQEKKFGTIIYLDLDRFKILNDSLGHQAGDILLDMVAKRIRKVTRKNDFCARLGGDEFIVLTKKLENTIEDILETTLVKSELILEALNEPYQLGDYEHLITPSIGISYFPMVNISSDQIIHQADIAMYASKNKGKNTITIYQDSMVKMVNERLKIEKAVRQALDNDEFQLHYQPQYNELNQIFSVEALLRWDKAIEFNIDTEDIIKTIEKIGLTHELGYWVFDRACAQLEKWQKHGHSINSISINVSAKQFKQKLFVDQVKSVIKSYNLIPSQIVIELTEAVIIDDMVSLVEKLGTLKQYGVRTSLDDFGTGYSSFAYLKHLPIDQLKIDKMFINDLSFDQSSQHIVKTIIDLAEALNIELVAEGVEIKEQFEILKNLGCKKYQGFYFSKALSGDKIFKS